MLTVSKLEEAMGDSDWVVVRPDGEILNMAIPKDIGPATLMVSPVTDALSRSEGGLLVEPVDRSKVWNVEAFAVNRVVVRRLTAKQLSAAELYETVTGFRLSWQMSEFKVS